MKASPRSAHLPVRTLYSLSEGVMVQIWIQALLNGRIKWNPAETWVIQHALSLCMESQEIKSWSQWNLQPVLLRGFQVQASTWRTLSSNMVSEALWMNWKPSCVNWNLISKKISFHLNITGADQAKSPALKSKEHKHLQYTATYSRDQDVVQKPGKLCLS